MWRNLIKYLIFQCATVLWLNQEKLPIEANWKKPIEWSRKNNIEQILKRKLSLTYIMKVWRILIETFLIGFLYRSNRGTYIIWPGPEEGGGGAMELATKKKK